MGYDLHITRRQHWSDDEEPAEDITLKEWLDYIDSDPDIELSDAYRIKVPGSETESQAAPGFCEWINHPSDEKPWFDYWRGNISTKNPDDDVIRKMVAISKMLKAKVQGDDGEIYELSSDDKISYSQVSQDEKKFDSSGSPKKPWWKLW